MIKCQRMCWTALALLNVRQTEDAKVSFELSTLSESLKWINKRQKLVQVFLIRKVNIGQTLPV